MNSFDGPKTRPALWACIVASQLACLLVNGMIFGLGWSGPARGAHPVSIEPPDILVGTVWIAWFSLMGYAWWSLGRSKGSVSSQLKYFLAAIFVSDLLYPLYALATHSLAGGLIGNLWTIAICSVFVRLAWKSNRTAAMSVLPQIPWVVYASVVIVMQMI